MSSTMSSTSSDLTRRARRVRGAIAALACGALAALGAVAAVAHEHPPAPQVALNSQPLPPRGGDDLVGGRVARALPVSAHACIGETEK